MRRKRFLSASKMKVELIRRTGRSVFVRTSQGRSETAGYSSRHQDRCPRLNPEHRCCRCMLAKRPNSWNHQHWSPGPLARSVKLRVAHVPGMLVTFSPAPRVSDPDMHHGTCVMHVPWSLNSSFFWSQWWGKHSRRMRNLQFYVSGKRPMQYSIRFRLYQCLEVPFLVPVCQYVAVAAMAGLGIGLHVLSDIQLLLNMCGQSYGVQFVWSAHHNPGWWKKNLSLHDTEKGAVSLWCDRLK